MNVYVKDPQQQAQACVIWMHGLGADAQDMAGLAAQLPVNIPIRHVSIDAPVRPVTINNRMPMRAWYDIAGVKLTDREDSEGIGQSESLIRQVIDNQRSAGFASEQIFLAGFSASSFSAIVSAEISTMSIGLASFGIDFLYSFLSSSFVGVYALRPCWIASLAAAMTMVKARIASSFPGIG